MDDRETGGSGRPCALKTHSDILALFHLSPEDKIENSGPWGVERTRRPHVVKTGGVLLGKEANKEREYGEPHPVNPDIIRSVLD